MLRQLSRIRDLIVDLVSLVQIRLRDDVDLGRPQLWFSPASHVKKPDSKSELPCFRTELPRGNSHFNFIHYPRRPLKIDDTFNSKL